MSELSDSQIEKVKRDVRELLGGDKSGHADDHIERVAALAGKFADNCNEEVDKNEVLLTAWLHDVDDYKLVGRKHSEDLQNANRFMKNANIPIDIQNNILDNIANIGYSKRLRGKSPERLSGKIVSDADMCDAIGAVGIERALVYVCHHDGRIFDPKVWPNTELSGKDYNSNAHDTSGFINHFFEKLLKLKSLMLTEPGLTEATARHDIMVEFLRNYFREKNATEWNDFLDEYLNLIDKSAIS